MCLIVGKVYKLAPPEPNDGDLLRVIDESGKDYLYPASYFEPLVISDEPATDSVTTHLPPWLKGVLYAEAVAADKPVSALLREWIEERLDLPVSVQTSLTIYSNLNSPINWATQTFTLSCVRFC